MGTWRDRFVEVSVGPTALVAASKNPTVSLTSQRRGPLQVSTLSGMCGLTIDAVQAELSMTLPADVEVWSLSLLYSTYVDVRQLWRPSQDLCSPTPKGTTWQGPGKDLLYAEAGAGPEGRYGEAQHKLAPGTHHVTMIAWLPGTSFRCQGDIDVTLNPN